MMSEFADREENMSQSEKAKNHIFQEPPKKQQRETGDGIVTVAVFFVCIQTLLTIFESLFPVYHMDFRYYVMSGSTWMLLRSGSLLLLVLLPYIASFQKWAFYSMISLELGSILLVLLGTNGGFAATGGQWALVLFMVAPVLLLIARQKAFTYRLHYHFSIGSVLGGIFFVLLQWSNASYSMYILYRQMGESVSIGRCYLRVIGLLLPNGQYVTQHGLSAVPMIEGRFCQMLAWFMIISIVVTVVLTIYTYFVFEHGESDFLQTIGYVVSMLFLAVGHFFQGRKKKLPESDGDMQSDGESVLEIPELQADQAAVEQLLAGDVQDNELVEEGEEQAEETVEEKEEQAEETVEEAEPDELVEEVKVEAEPEETVEEKEEQAEESIEEAEPEEIVEKVNAEEFVEENEEQAQEPVEEDKEQTEETVKETEEEVEETVKEAGEEAEAEETIESEEDVENVQEPIEEIVEEAEGEVHTQAEEIIENEEAVREPRGLTGCVADFAHNFASYMALDTGGKVFEGTKVEGYIPYRVIGKEAVISGGPICAPEDMQQLLSEYEEFCFDKKISMTFVNVSREQAEAMEQWRYSKVHCGAEPRFILKQYKLRSPAAVQNQREKIRQKYGVMIYEYRYYEERNPELEMQLSALNDDWLDSRNGENFTIYKRRQRDAFLPQTLSFDNENKRRYYYAVNEKNEIAGFIVFCPVISQNGYSCEAGRKRPGQIKNLMELIMHEAFAALKEEGANWASMGLIPDSHEKGELTVRQQRWQDFIYRYYESIYACKDYKEAMPKYKPTTWENMYIVTREYQDMKKERQ
ncbi:MAG: DUF2156 domain-containing protein [Lachnospira sp.]|nr:DUF2156 domain-containing protein [Lachnospira sp.]